MLERQLAARRLLRSAHDRRAYQVALNRALCDAALHWLPRCAGPVKTLFDIGAARGEVALELDRLYELDQVVLVEPGAGHTERLKKLKVGRRTQVFACAIGETAGTAEFNVLSSVDSSSLLKPISAKAEAAFPGFNFRPAATLPVKVMSLDDLFAASGATGIDLLKVDVQGNELNVFKGGARALQHTRYIHVEISFEPMYEQQALFPEVYDYLRNRGFEIISLADVVSDPRGLPIQADLTLVNRNLLT